MMLGKVKEASIIGTTIFAFPEYTQDLAANTAVAGRWQAAF